MTETKEALWEDLETNYPNNRLWSALVDGEVHLGESRLPLSVIDAGMQSLPSGELMICDPIHVGNDVLTLVKLPSGRYPVKITIADFSDDDDPDNFREAYVSIILDDSAQEVRRAIFPDDPDIIGKETDDDANEHCVYVDTASCALFDAHAFPSPVDDDMVEAMTDDENPQSWFARMDDTTHIRDGIANMPIEGSDADQNIVLVHTGWGDGAFPILGGYDAGGKLVRVHIDFMVVAPSPIEDE